MDTSSQSTEVAAGAAPSSASAEYRYWQRRILISTIVGYALYYFVRKNLSYAMPEMERTLGIGKPQLGGYLTAHGLIYGASRFINGVWADRREMRGGSCPPGWRFARG